MDLFLCSSLYQNCSGSFLDIYVTNLNPPTFFYKFYISIFTFDVYFPCMFALEICNVQFSNHGVCVQVNHHILNRFIIVRLNEMFTYMTNLICIFEK